jgi:hypothetical protein
MVDQSLLGRIFTKIGLAIFAIALIDLVYINWWVLKSQELKVPSTELAASESQSLESRAVNENLAPSPTPIPFPSTSPDTKVETKTVVEKNSQTIVQTAQKEIFIPMGSGSSTSGTFADLAGTDVTIDTSKYSSIESVTFEASIRVEGGNGKATARVLNVDDKNPYIESEISTSSGTAVVKGSSKLPIPSGTRTYRVQAKTDITNFPAHITNARLKITLK